MLRRIAVMFAALAMLFGVLTSIGAAAQSNSTSITSLLGTQAAIYAGGQPGALASGMIAVQWPTQVMLDGRLQILSPDYRVLTLSAGDFVISDGQIYSDPTALLAAGYPQELVPTARDTAFLAAPRTPGSAVTLLSPPETDLPDADQLLAAASPVQADSTDRKILAFRPIAGTVYDYGSAAQVSTRPSSSLSPSSPKPGSMAFAPPAFAVPDYDARDGAFYDPSFGVSPDNAPSPLRGAGAVAGAGVGANTFIAVVPDPAPRMMGPPPQRDSTNGGMFAGIQQSVAKTPWFVWAGAGAAASGVAWVVLTHRD